MRSWRAASQRRTGTPALRPSASGGLTFQASPIAAKANPRGTLPQRRLTKKKRNGIRVRPAMQATTSGRIGNQRDSALSFGSFDVSIEPSLGLGMIINPTDWFQNEEISLAAIRQQERAAFVQSLRDFVDMSPHRSLLIVINGFRERFESALRKTAFVAKLNLADRMCMCYDVCRILHKLPVRHIFTSFVNL